MTNKELQKLGRRELLQLLLDQAKESERLGKLLKENDEHLKQLEESYERLRDRLDKKDAPIHELKDALQAERDKAEAASRLGGGFSPARQMAEQYPHRGQGYYPAHGGAAAPAPETGGLRPGFQAQPPYQGQGPAPYGGQYQQYQPQPADPFPYQVPPQSQVPFTYQSQTPDPFPYQVPYQEGAAPEPYPAGVEAQYQYPPPRPERKRQGGQHGKMPFRLKKDQENGKTTLFFGWQRN